MQHPTSGLELADTELPQNLEQLCKFFLSMLEADKPSPDSQLWTSSDVAKFLQVSEASVMKNYFYMPDFPTGFRLPSKRGLGSRRWFPADIKNWCERLNNS
ncbi:hypothetical protein DET61_1407 [Marinobacter nauticus]|jgi:predicted DNA-binding transcriptional regulator AlpA|uniref:Uncharacterized protein n=1 Tax=Marinobacter nauticus TaxID=2743 RepID=A0A368X1N7_MARNT|nr:MULTISPECIES: hypothetical protein [Marinobacter]ERS04183.1 hypothetical protein Q673_18415 [Marinobacter sp. EN3]MBN8239130.1 hypothetical protein [Marinobacter nauticus]RCW61930.1 hypothetical protein DET61_1407 [Marinobacter nauticus]TPW22180.1 hypothetical protein FH712_18080 [Marinobacter nauticus]|tara:strand:+ start:640 stop:942 length:303 start_codon:yes stop_codon:yes gene_type:complete